MNCWKSINIIQDYGSLRINMIAISNGLIFFLLFYLILSTIFPNNRLVPIGFFPLFLSILIIPFIHKLFHCLPIWMLGKRATLCIRIKGKMPIIHCLIEKPLSKNQCFIVSLFPVIILTMLAIVFANYHPGYIHYIAIIASINFGMSTYDFIYAKKLLTAPKRCYIEDNPSGFHILIRQ